MVISFDWLKQYVDIDIPVEEVGRILTDTGLEVEGISNFEVVEGGLQGLKVGQVLTCEKHPNADSLSLTTVDVGEESPLQIVCGAPNIAAGLKVVVATVGTTLYPVGHDSFKIKKGKIRGEVSLGMICAEDEIGLGGSHDGIIVLDDSTKVGIDAAVHYGLENDSIIEIGLTPNRADGASHFGVARDLKAALKKELRRPDVSSFKVSEHTAKVNITIENKEACPRYSGLVIKGVTVKDSPEWMQVRLKSIGIKPTNNVVDATNYVLHELGQPLHAFDFDQVGDEVVVKDGLSGTKFVTLDETERTLLQDDLMICNSEKPMCIAGVLGGIDSGVTEKTTSIFLESAYFSPGYVRKTSMKHGIKTDASFRYERGTDPEITVYALKRAALLIQEIAGGEVVCDIIDEYPSPLIPQKIDLSFARIHQLIGEEIPRDRIQQILLDLDFTFLTSDIFKEDEFIIEAPLYRVDVTREADVIEEIIRIFGYNNFKDRSINAGFIANFDKPGKNLLKEKIADLLSGRGFSEVITNSISNSDYYKKHDFLHEDWLVKILNYNSEDLDVLRTNMIFSHLEVLKSNLNRKQKNLSLYEFGKVYRLNDGAYIEREKIAILMYGHRNHESWRAKTSESLKFVDAFSTVEMILDRVGVEFSSEPMADPKKYQYGIRILSKKGELIGRIGVLASDFNQQFSIDEDVLFVELEWERIVEKYSEKVLFKELSKFPMVRRDLSIVIPQTVSFEDVKRVAYMTERKILKEINVFDVYQGENLGENKKSYSVSFGLQDQQKTLNDKIIDKTMDRLIQMYEKELGAVIRR